MSRSRSRRSIRYTSARSRPKTEPEAIPEQDAEAEDREARRARDFEELLALARAPLLSDGEIEEALRPGSIVWADDEHPARLPPDAKPHDLARETQARRERLRVRGDGVAFDPETGRTVVTQRALAAAALGELRRRIPRVHSRAEAR